MSADRGDAPPLPGPGHNLGPSMDDGRAWRVHAWSKARAARPEARLPVEIVRMRKRRAAELGLDYRTYASVRSYSGRDISGLLFSSNALGLFATHQRLPDAVADRLRALHQCRRIALLHPPLDPVALADRLESLDRLYRAPRLLGSWPAMRDAMARVQDGLPAAALVLIGAAPLERDWAGAGRLGGYLDAARYFGAHPGLLSGA
ncbi:hypothetical protein [Pseudooceanicola pacificus]|uniref:hypothetical protein n=1 Tax=Pseudooceanicola pacificus TaxID=2676438 RepID=UPI001F396439|nr:hypothetical protein [Pseudooceanicola pacificus]